jgi:RNA polymerase sigma-70 factor (ECF subfamily)
VSLAREGDESAFEEIVRRHSPRVFRTASRFFRQPAQVEDVAQEAFLKAYTQLSTYKGFGSFEGWLTRLTTNLCLNTLRNAKRQPELSVSPLTDEEGEWLENQSAAASIERHRASERGFVAFDLAEKVLSELPADDRLVLMAIDGDHLSVAEVAEMTGWSKSKVKVRAFRARRRMRKAVEKLLER